jgi:hypothetical protein
MLNIVLLHMLYIDQQEKKLKSQTPCANSTLGLFPGRGQDKMFEIMDEHDRSSEAGRQGIYFLLQDLTSLSFYVDRLEP